MNYLWLCGWALCLSIAFAGWGNLSLRCCRVRDSNVALAGAVGAALLTAMGGVLNLLHLLLPAVLLIAIAAGDILAAVLIRPFPVRISLLRSWLTRFSQLPRGALFLALLVLAAVAIPVLGNVQIDPRSFNVNDDLPSYVTLPPETLQLHTLPFDPFNERRVTSSLGASYVLQAFALLPGGDIGALRMIDVSLGTLLYAGLAFTIFRRLGLALSYALALTLLIFAVPVIRLNTTFVVLPAAWFCALFLLQVVPAAAERFGISCLLALLSAALCAVKSNYLPAALVIGGLFYGVSWLLLPGRRRGSVAMAGLLWAVLTGVFLLPWMLDMHAKEGTYLFPLLGRGYDASAYGVIPLPSGSHHSIGSGALSAWLSAALMAGPLCLALPAVAAFYWKAFHQNDRQGREWGVALLAMLAGGALAILAISASTGGESLGRYSLPFQAPALLIFFGWLLWKPLQSPTARTWARPAAIGTGLYLALLGLGFGVRLGEFRHYAEDARLLTPSGASWFSPEREVKRQQSMQAAIPAGERLLARLFVSYALDFRRNQIFLPDFTGMAGFRPGMPIDGDLPALVRYLDRNSIHYVAYDYGRTLLDNYDPGISLTAMLADPASNGRHGWLHLQMKVSNFEQRQIMRLAERYPRVYDDGSVFVLHLSPALR